MRKLVYQMDLISGEINDHDFFLLSGGSDYRAYEVLRKMKSKDTAINKILLFDFYERVRDIDKSDPYFEYQTIGFNNILPIKCSIRDPNSCLQDLIPLEAEFLSTTAPKIALDISCFTKPYFFYLLKLFKERFKIDSISVFYTEPQFYLFPGGISSAYRSSTGPLTILEIPGFSGYESRGDRRVLVILLGFDGDLSKEINEDISPSETLVINGFPSYSPKFKDISLVANEKLTSDRDIKVKFSRANNPFEVFNILEGIKNENGKSFINIAPLGTKPMALGACLFALNYPDVRVVYPLPEMYEKVTTNSCWNSWRYSFL
ncbi:MAG: hypothetical protein E3K37_12565 [Candidatus Kuenenia sp.]|nr:hypothetical protein [Candidatus Kuenenia hertensis]